MPVVLEAQEISFIYPQNNRGLAPVSLSLAENEGVFISGNSGSGKSTFTRCLSGLIPHLYRGEFSGKVLIHGDSTQDLPMWELADRVGLVFQNPAHQMLAPTVEAEILFGLENLGISRADMKQRLEEIFGFFKLEPFRNRSPHTLSGGEQQKLALASILARQPEIFIFDEPLSMLDTTSALEFVAHVENLINKGKSAVICEHRDKFLENSTHFRKFLLPGIHQPPAEQQDITHPDYPESLDQFQLQVRNLSVEKSGNKIIREMSFSLDSGQIVAIVGRNGAGKTTLLRSLVGLQKHNGDICINNGTINQKPHFRMVFQNPDIQLFNPSVKDEILFKVSRPNMQRYEWLLEMLDLRRYEDTPPLLLSEGEKRRLALALTLMQNGKHGVLLDEPALGQDQHHKDILIQLLKKLSQAGFLVIFTTHDLELAAHADHLILISPQGIVADGPTHEVLHADSAWQQIGLVRPDWMTFDV
ncbi:MAG: ATP-binding cassette domain-containing protein [Anaerolineaceae bacterium]|nr:ATP-binding cassette domain-containing protein [Anaerolineaceae bacterium]